METKELSKNGFVVYRASAGSGKTHEIVSKITKKLLDEPQNAYRGLLAVTFTIAAAGEMKHRILSELKTLAQTNNDAKIALDAILNDFANLNITTIDAFFQKILRNLTKELGITSQFTIETDILLPIREAVNNLVETAAADQNILDKILKFLEYRLQDEKWNIMREMEAFSVNIFNESFQKQEKYFREQLKNNPEKINNSIDECNLIKMSYEKTLDELATKFIYDNKENFFYGERGTPLFIKKIRAHDYSEPNNFVYQVLNGAKGKSGDIKNLSLLQNIEQIRSDGLSRYNSAALFLKYIYQLQLLDDISQKIDENSRKNNRFILAKTNIFLRDMIGGEDESFIYERIAANIKSIVIDEFQDTSVLQWENFLPIIKDILAQGGFSMLVGDVKQSIYRWRNGDWRILNDIDKNFGEAATYCKLSNNWRSARKIVEFNNEFFASITGNMCADIQKAYADVAQNPMKDSSGFVEIDFAAAERSGREITKKYDDAMLEKLAAKVKILLHNGIPQSDITILCRKGAQIRKIAEALPKLVSGVRIISEEAYLFGNSRELKQIIAAMRLITNTADIISAATILHLQGNAINKINQEKCEKITQKILAANTTSLVQTTQNICALFHFFDGDVSEFIAAFIDSVLEFSTKKFSNIENFLEYWDERLSRETLPLPNAKNDARDGILAMTIHKSKGLQFNTVIVPFADWSLSEHSTPAKQNLVWCAEKKDAPFDLALMPVEYSAKMEKSVFGNEYLLETEAQNMDNLNILYVALTRAEENLFVIAQDKKNSVGELLAKYLERKEYEHYTTNSAKH